MDGDANEVRVMMDMELFFVFDGLGFCPKKGWVKTCGHKVFTHQKLMMFLNRQM